MKTVKSLKTVGTSASIVAIALAGMLISSPRAQAQETEATLSQVGLSIAPVPLNLTGLDPTMVGLGSYFVNAVGDCNGCHTGGGVPNFNYAAGRNPYFGQPTQVDQTVYLSGGDDFGPVGTPTGPNMYQGPDIVSRNLTPDQTGLPAGRTLAEFLQVMTIGRDYDNLHPTCTPGQLTQIQSGTTPPPVCIPTSPGNTPVGSLLQVMPWPTFARMTQADLTAIYTYLSAIPCLEGSTDTTSPLHHDCGSGGTTPPPPTGVTIVITGPGGATSATNTFTVLSNSVNLDASKSTSSNVGPLSYSWTEAPGYPSVGIPGGNTATPSVIFPYAGTYQLILTVTDSKGVKATATVTLTYS
jgi:hypothetical protein